MSMLERLGYQDRSYPARTHFQALDSPVACCLALAAFFLPLHNLILATLLDCQFFSQQLPRTPFHPRPNLVLHWVRALLPGININQGPESTSVYVVSLLIEFQKYFQPLSGDGIPHDERSTKQSWFSSLTVHITTSYCPPTNSPLLGNQIFAQGCVFGTFEISSTLYSHRENCNWLQTASAGFQNWESCAQRGFGKAKLAVMCRRRLKAPSPQYSILQYMLSTKLQDV